MELFNSTTYRFENNEFQIRTYYDDTCINVIAFLNGHPASGFRYQVKLPKNCAVKKILQNAPLNELVEKCKNDINENKWAQWEKIIQMAFQI
jgi:hypothetical protein